METKVSNLTSIVIKNFVDSFESADKSSKALFSGYYNKAKAFRDNKKALTELHKEYKDTLNSLTNNQAVVNRFNRVINLADNYIKMEVFSKFDLLYFYNIEAMVNLIKYFEQDMDIKKSILKKIAKVYIKDMPQVDYNNALSALIQEIKKEYKIIDTEKGFLSLEKQLGKIVYSLSKEQKQSLMEIIQRSLLDDK